MIVRIMTEDQYRIDDAHTAEISQLDDALEQALEGDDDSAFQQALQHIIAFVQQHGQPVPMEEVVASDVIVPAHDMSREEARQRLHSVESHSAQS